MSLHQPRALLSVSNKTGLVPFAQKLLTLGFELVSTGGTYTTLHHAGLAVKKVSEVTGLPEILEGRVKTLHPNIHGGILAKRTPEHLATLNDHSISPIDVVVVNLYPFRETIVKPNVTMEEAIENIDIGGPAMIRAAAKNHEGVLVLVDPSDYDSVAEALTNGVTCELRLELARKAFAHTATYDAAIVTWLDRDTMLPPSLHLSLEKTQELRYGENPHQVGARYRETSKTGWWDSAVQHSGIALSYLNIFDAEAAWQLAHEFTEAACVIVKHANPCGVAIDTRIERAYERAFECDPKSAFGGIVALNQPVSLDLAKELAANPKADVLIAPSFDAEGLELFKTKRKNMRVIEAKKPQRDTLELRRIDAGFLVQQSDKVLHDRSGWSVVSKAQPTEAQWQDMELAWLVCAYTKSNAIVLAKAGQAVGIAAGQQSRVDSVEIAVKKAAGRAKDGACASDAFFPFRDGLDVAAQSGISAVIQPGGSVKDNEIIATADEHGLVMVMTGMRHFRH
ncbi:MAG: bifunctional phosphoribosylaminoimidazolecarboxamide formyltransferase/IMP cyclohydrolase [Trueperaceae bacterium]